MYCPKCRVDYREDVTHCIDCSFPLLSGRLSGNPDLRPGLVAVFESNDACLITLVKGVLEQAGIPFRVQGDETGPRLLLGPILYPVCRFLVSPTREADARALLDPFARPHGA